MKTSSWRTAVRLIVISCATLGCMPRAVLVSPRQFPFVQRIEIRRLAYSPAQHRCGTTIGPTRPTFAFQLDEPVQRLSIQARSSEEVRDPSQDSAVHPALARWLYLPVPIAVEAPDGEVACGRRGEVIGSFGPGTYYVTPLLETELTSIDIIVGGQPMAEAAQEQARVEAAAGEREAAAAAARHGEREEQMRALLAEQRFRFVRTDSVSEGAQGRLTFRARARTCYAFLVSTEPGVLLNEYGWPRVDIRYEGAVDTFSASPEFHGHFSVMLFKHCSPRAGRYTIGIVPGRRAPNLPPVTIARYTSPMSAAEAREEERAYGRVQQRGACNYCRAQRRECELIPRARRPASCTSVYESCLDQAGVGSCR